MKIIESIETIMRAEQEEWEKECSLAKINGINCTNDTISDFITMYDISILELKKLEAHQRVYENEKKILSQLGYPNLILDRYSVILEDNQIPKITWPPTANSTMTKGKTRNRRGWFQDTANWVKNGVVSAAKSVGEKVKNAWTATKDVSKKVWTSTKEAVFGKTLFGEPGNDSDDNKLKTSLDSNSKEEILKKVDRIIIVRHDGETLAVIPGGLEGMELYIKHGLTDTENANYNLTLAIASKFLNYRGKSFLDAQEPVLHERRSVKRQRGRRGLFGKLFEQGTKHLDDVGEVAIKAGTDITITTKGAKQIDTSLELTVKNADAAKDTATKTLVGPSKKVAIDTYDAVAAAYQNALGKRRVQLEERSFFIAKENLVKRGAANSLDDLFEKTREGSPQVLKAFKSLSQYDQNAINLFAMSKLHRYNAKAYEEISSKQATNYFEKSLEVDSKLASSIFMEPNSYERAILEKRKYIKEKKFYGLQKRLRKEEPSEYIATYKKMSKDSQRALDEQAKQAIESTYFFKPFSKSGIIIIIHYSL
eukprot:Pgem_evm1s1411